MSIAEAVIEKLNALPPEKQEEVLQYVEKLATPATPAPTTAQPHSWLKVAMSMNLDGPSDMSAHLDDYLYGDKKNAL